MHEGGEEKLKKVEIFKLTWINTSGYSLIDVEASNVTYPNTVQTVNSVALVRERTIPTERPPPVGEVSANFCG